MIIDTLSVNARGRYNMKMNHTDWTARLDTNSTIEEFFTIDDNAGMPHPFNLPTYITMSEHYTLDLDRDLDSTRIKVDALGHTSTPF